MGIKNWLKTRIRRLLNLPDLEEKIQQISNDTKILIERLQNIDKELHTSFTEVDIIRSLLLELINNSKSGSVTEVDIIRSLLLELINNSKSGSVFTCKINNITLLAPVELLRLYPHCIHPQSEQKLTYFVETQHSDWLCSKLNPGDTTLDIGAAFGVITLALSKAVGEQGYVYSFEPSKTAQRSLQKVLELNHIQNVTIVESAIADLPDSTEFIEYTSDNELSWASDASTLASPTINPAMKHLRYHVDVTTIDKYVTAKSIQPKGIKIDIEGFELYALQGGKTTLEKYLPYLCIDIHLDVKTGVSTLEGIEPFLSEIGYEMEMKDHVLFCTPKQAKSY